MLLRLGKLSVISYMAEQRSGFAIHAFVGIDSFQISITLLLTTLTPQQEPQSGY